MLLALLLLSCEPTIEGPCDGGVCHCDSVEADRWCRQFDDVTPDNLAVDQAIAQCDAGVAAWSGEPGDFGPGPCPTAAMLGRCGRDNGLGVTAWDSYYEGFAGVAAGDPQGVDALRASCETGLEGVWEAAR